MKKTRLSLRARLVAMTLLAMGALLVLFAVVLFGDRSQLMNSKQEKIRNLVESAHGVISFFESVERAGHLSRADAQKAAMTAIRAMRYDKTEYFWINDLTPTVVMHPVKPELDGKDMSQLKDPKGKLLFNEFVAVVKRDGAGYVDYYWPKPGESAPVPKISYVKGFAPWGWIVGTGIYIDDVDRAFRDAAIRFLLWGLAIGAIIVVPMLLLHRNLSRLLGGEPQHAVDAARRIAGGDLGAQIRCAKDDSESLMAVMAHMQDSLRSMISEVTSQAAQLSGNAEMMMYAAEQVSGRSQSQSDAAQDIAAAVEEMTASIDQIAHSAADAHSIAAGAGTLADQGGAVIQEASGEIHRLSAAVHTSSAQIQQLERHANDITSIVNTIKEIADQTNLLALNAAIEAARAGEQGRGFAVVADEVRKLSERTSASTSEIANMISRIQSGTHEAVASMTTGESQATQGVALANRAGESIAEIRDSAQRVTGVVTAISDSIRQQSAASGEISSRIERIAQMTEEGAEEAERTLAAAREMQEMSQVLHQSVGRFTLN